MSTIYEVLKNNEPVFASTNFDSAKRSYHAYIGVDKTARLDLVENATTRPDFKITKLLRSGSQSTRYKIIESHKPRQRDNEE